MPHVLLQYVPAIYGILRRSTMRKAFVLQLIPISSDFLWFKIAFLIFSKLLILFMINRAGNKPVAE